jgi:hypothetical protein
MKSGTYVLLSCGKPAAWEERFPEAISRDRSATISARGTTDPSGEDFQTYTGVHYIPRPNPPPTYGVEGGQMTYQDLPNGAKLFLGNNVQVTKDGKGIGFSPKNESGVYLSYEGPDASDVQWIQFFKVTFRPAVLVGGKVQLLPPAYESRDMGYDYVFTSAPFPEGFGDFYYVDALNVEKGCYTKEPYYYYDGSTHAGGIVPGAKSFIFDRPHYAGGSLHVFLENWKKGWKGPGAVVGGVVIVTFYDYAVNVKTHKIVASATYTETYGELADGLASPEITEGSVLSMPVPLPVDSSVLEQQNSELAGRFGFKITQ